MLIGGMACDLLMSDAGLDFRRTKDIDMVLIVESAYDRLPVSSGASSDEGGCAGKRV
ncbi:MAG: hypothetical protein ACLUEQ_12415 [Cloacibacillus evryensis]